jgi:hypothetical protein
MQKCQKWKSKLCYKTFYVRNLRIFIVSQMFVPDKLFKAILTNALALYKFRKLLAEKVL